MTNFGRMAARFLFSGRNVSSKIPNTYTLVWDKQGDGLYPLKLL